MSVMDDVSCPNCKTTKYRKSDLVLMVNVCGHSLCENCVNRLFMKGSGECPECKLTLRRAAFRLQLFEDSSVDKECDIRRKVLAVYNRLESDFKSLREYNDYLEEVETIIYNLSNGVEVEETKLTMERYKEANKEVIMQNRHKISKDEALLDMMIEHERAVHEMSQHMAQEEETRNRQLRIKQREDLIVDLTNSNMPANQIVEHHRKDTVVSMDTSSHLSAISSKPTTKFSSGVSIGFAQEVVPVPREVTAPATYVYSPLGFEWLGPTPPSPDKIMSNNYLRHVRAAPVSEMAGGYMSIIACQRALQDAFCGLCFVPTDSTDLVASVS